jgi:hypothetical protein
VEQVQMGVAMNEALAAAHTWLETVKPQVSDDISD